MDEHDVTSNAHERWCNEMQRALEAAGFADLESRPNIFAFQQIASALRHGRPLDKYDMNDLIGTPNGLGSGWVAMRLAKLEERGYLTVSDPQGVQLTEKGARAARVLAIDIDRA
jgi:hypothetical protein